MKKFNPETLIIPGFLLIIIAFIILGATESQWHKTTPEPKNFTGIDAAGFTYINGNRTGSIYDNKN